MTELFVYFFIALGLMVGVAWMVIHTLQILLGADRPEVLPSRHFDRPVSG